MAVLLPSGNILICKADSNGDRDPNSQIVVYPRPTYTDYGDRVRYTLQESEGKTIKQRSKRNPKAKKWVWEGYGPHVPRYNELYKTLFNLQEDVLVYVASGSPYVYIRDEITQGLGQYELGTEEFVDTWVRARVLMVDRTVAQRGGYVTYDETSFTFTVDDPDLRLY